MAWLRSWWQECADVVLPTACAGCGSPRARGQVCGGCRTLLASAVPHLVAGGDPGPTVWAAAPYEDQTRALLLAHKERGALALAAPLGAGLLALAVRAAVPPVGRAEGTRRPPLALVPVPSGRQATARRGHDPVRRLARAAAARLRADGEPCAVVPVLRHVRGVADQSGLDAAGRAANLAGALEVVRGAAGLLEGTRVVVVDDLVTTGATLREAVRAVRAAWPIPEVRPAEGAPHTGRGGRGGEGARDVRAAVVAARCWRG